MLKICMIGVINIHFESIIDSVYIGVIVVKEDGVIAFANKLASDLLGDDLVGCKVNAVFPQIKLQEVFNTGKNKPWHRIDVNNNQLIISIAPSLENNKVSEAVISIQELSNFDAFSSELEAGKKLLNEVKNLNELYRQLTEVFDYCFDEIYVTDGNGVTLFVSKVCEEFYGVKVEDMVGKNVWDLEKQGMFSRSVTSKVLEKKEQVTLLQTTKNGKKLLVTANPIWGENGEIETVVTISRDMTELSNLKDKLAETEELSMVYLTEIEKLRTGKSKNECNVIAESGQMKEILEMVKRIAKVDSTVLIEGESGVGKGVIAFRIHKLSRRSNKSFMSVNCSAIPENLIESELFGYEEGAFTGASKSGKKGYFEMTDGGTILLDEIGEIPLGLQVKLLQVIQEKKIRRVGGNKDIAVDVRIITATNQDIKKLVREGTFREDLFYRLYVVPLWIPPLRHRREDISPLIEQFLKEFNDQYKLKKQIMQDALDYLNLYDWPGNVRELANLIERLVVTTDSDLIKGYHLPSYVLNSDMTRQNEVTISGICTLKKAIEEAESQLIKRAYEKYGNTYKIAEVLQVNQSTVVRKIHKYLGKCNK